MTARQVLPAFRRLLAHSDDTLGDAQLLQRFVTRGDEAAFEVLVWRHGRMVMGVCTRVLGQKEDAEDAFQATLLALARKAGSIGRGESVGGWLYRVAYRVALRARATARRRLLRERPAAQLPAVADPHATDPGCAEVRPVLDEELNRLAEKHRAPVVLCYLEGLTNEEAARRLGWPVGTVKTRLAHARRVLARRLLRRGLAPGAAAVAAGTAPAGPALPAALVGATVRAAGPAAAGKLTAAGAVSASVAGLTQGVLRAMLVTKLKLAALALGMGLAVAGAGAVSYRALAGEALAPRAGAEPGPRKDTPAEARVRRIKKQIAGLREELSRAEEEAARQRAVPPRGPVAVIYGDVPITRDELAEHLLSRMRPEQLEGYINRRILEQACRKAGVAVTAEEVNDALKAELGKMNFSEKAFGDQLRAQHKTLREWKEDVLRPRLLMKKLAARGVRVTEKEVRHFYEARYGEKVECEFLMWPAHQKEAARQAAERLRRNGECFDELARQRPPASRVVAIGRSHDERLEKVVFALRPGEVSELIEVSGAFAVLKCRRRIPPDKGTRFEDVREKLKGELEDRLRQQDTEALFRRLKAEARVRLLWKPAEERAP